MALHAIVLAGVALIAAATLAGAWISSGAARMPAVALRAASVLLFAVVLGDLLPDVWRDLPGSGLPWWGAAGAGAAGFAAAGALTRLGCACAAGQSRLADRPVAGDRARHGGSLTGSLAGSPAARTGAGWGAAAALAAHRALEGAAVTLAGSAAVIAALVIHAAAEGFALSALLRSGRRRLALLLLVACVSPLAGALLLSELRVPAAVSVLLTCVIAGVLGRSALTAWRAGRVAPEPGSHTASRAAAVRIMSHRLFLY